MNRKKLLAIQKRLEKIAKEGDGRLTPEAVIDDARNPLSPLHSHFDWDDTVAAKQWRLQQARELIRSVKMEIKTESRTVSVVRYVRDPSADAKDAGYSDISKIATQDDLARIALNRELTSALALMERASSIAIALGLETEFNEALDRIKQLRTRVDLAA